MNPTFESVILVPTVTALLWTGTAPENQGNDAHKAEAGTVTLHSQGLHGYIGYSATRPPARSEYSAGMGFYSAVWSLIDKPIARFQIGLPGAWITPDNSDNKDKPLAPVGTLARDNWPERGPTWSSVFQTVEGGLGYWARNRFRYGPPKFSMNATSQCYDYEIASPGWSFFYDTSAAAGAWIRPGPVLGPFMVTLADGSLVTYSWYRFIDQPSFQQYDWSEAKKEKLQSFVEQIHANWPIDRDYMAPPSSGELVTLNTALLVTPPKGLEVGYVPIVTRQEDADD